MWCGTWAPAACRLQHQNQASWLFAHPIAPQKDTPQPTDADVRVVEYESITVFVRVFSGFATEASAKSACSAMKAKRLDCRIIEPS